RRLQGRRRGLDEQGGAQAPSARQGDARRRMAHARPDPHRRIEPAQRPAAPVRQNPERALRAPRGLLQGMTTEPRTSIVWDYAPAPEATDHVRLADRYGLFIDAAF